MGFFGGLGKIIQGKPVFDENAPKPGEVFRNDSGEKIYPELIVERSECHQDGDRLQVYAYIKNISAMPLVLDRLRFLGSDKHMPSDLSVGEAMEYLIYDGPKPRSTANGNFEMTYCNNARDYFSALYFADFKQEADGTYSVRQFRRQRQVKDI